MTFPRVTTLAALFALAVPMGAGQALADPPHCPPGHAKKGWCSPGPKHVWRRGDYIPRDRYIIIDDYDRYGYRRPPSGYRYVRVDGDVFLIALATGLIVDALR